MYSQDEVHGLLGQNAINPPLRHAPAVQPCAPGSATAVAVGAGAIQLDKSCPELVSTESQGEGFIDGSYEDYRVRGCMIVVDVGVAWVWHSPPSELVAS